MSSTNSQKQTKQQQSQAGTRNMATASRSTASTSKLRTGNGPIDQGGCRSEPPRSKPSFRAPSTILPSDSISVREGPSATSEKSRPGNGRKVTGPWDLKPAPKNLKISPSEAAEPPPVWGWAQSVANSQNPPSTYQSNATHSSTPTETGQRSAPSSRSAASRGTSQNQPPSSVSGRSGSVGTRTAASTARVPSQQLSAAPRAGSNNPAPTAMDGTWAGYSGQTSARGYSNTVPQQPGGLSIGVPPTGEFHFHYNQVDNRRMTVNNDSSHHMVTNNNQTYNTDNSNHHNNNAPQSNNYNNHATNSGNTYTDVHQQATSVRQSIDSSNYGGRRSTYQPSESLPIREKLYTTVKSYKLNDWTDKVTKTHQRVVDDRPC